MASKNKRKKMINSYFVPSVLKNRFDRMKRYFFYTASQRQENKKIDDETS
jgi:hypothetical protein